MKDKERNIICETGGDMWRDNVSDYGIDEAVIICKNYLNLNLKREHPDDERKFCRELFTAMFEATAGKTDTAKLVYPYSFEEANKRMETEYYNKSRKRNSDCAKGIDAIIGDSCYKANCYNLEIAAMRAVMDYGFPRVNLVLAFNIQRRESDVRISPESRKWAETFTVPEKSFISAYLDSHAGLIDTFVSYVRELYATLCAGRYALPGSYDYNSELVNGYAIMRSIMVDDEQGYVIAYNPESCDPCVCWQFMIRDGARQYNLGVYGSEQHVTDSYIARVIVHYKK